MVLLVLVRVPVPPAPVGAGALRDVGRAAGGLRLERGIGRYGLLDDRLPRRTLPSPLWRSRPLGSVTEEVSQACVASRDSSCAGYAAIRPGCARSRIDPVRLPPYATSCAAGLRTSDVAGCARICCMSPRLSRRHHQYLDFQLAVGALPWLSGFFRAIRAPGVAVPTTSMSVPEPFPT